jgi:hypothetical protein
VGINCMLLHRSGLCPSGIGEEGSGESLDGVCFDRQN